MITDEDEYELDDTILRDVPVDEENLDVSPKAVIDIVQRRRLRMILSNEAVSKETLKLLSDTATTSLAELRIKSEDKLADGIRDLVDLANKMQGTPDRRIIEATRVVSPGVIPDNLLPNMDVPPSLILDGEDSIDYETVMKTPLS